MNLPGGNLKIKVNFHNRKSSVLINGNKLTRYLSPALDFIVF